MVGWMGGWLSLCFVHPKSKSHSAFLCSGDSFHCDPIPTHPHPHPHIKPFFTNGGRSAKRFWGLSHLAGIPGRRFVRPLVWSASVASGLWKCHVSLEKQGGRLLSHSNNLLAYTSTDTDVVPL